MLAVERSTEPRDVLTQDEAEARAARVHDVEYEVALAFERGAETYRGETRVTFAAEGEDDLFLDHRGLRIERLEVNGRRLEPDWDGYRLVLRGASLAPHTEVRLVYENAYDRTGEGLHQFVDPEDGEEYLYTHFEPFGAHRLFPCFDQPDLKARYRLSVVAPAHWQVIANAPETAVEPTADGHRRWIFEPTLPFSTYLVALCAGPYEAMRGRHRDVPLGFFCRRTMRRHLEAEFEELLTITRQGLDFFATLFDYPYAFGKYDQVFVPEFNPGAMENVAAVTHHEDFLFRDPATENQRLIRGEVVLHEMAHMWFGDLTTLRWWNDLWLNESLATYLSYLALVGATRFDWAWRAFVATKRWAYREDQLVTTHPIAGPVPDTDHTWLNFDGITYGKGAAALKQLVTAIGPDGFREGMRRFFRRHAFGNATLADLLRALEEGSGHALGDWSRLWLETPSLDTLAADWRARDGRIEALRLRQTAPEAYPTLRPHSVLVALGREEDGRVAVEALPAVIEGAEAGVPGAPGRPAPAFVFPNHEDLTFAKVALDPVSLDWVLQRIDAVADPLLRGLLWLSLGEMVRDRQLRAADYLALVRRKMPSEPDLELVDVTLRNAATVLARFVPEERIDAESHALSETAWEALRALPAGDPKIIWARLLIRVAGQPADVALLLRLTDGAEPVPGFELDQEMRWSIATRAMAWDLPDAEERVAVEFRRDPSDRGQRAAIRARTSRPSATAKEEAWELIHGEGYGSLQLTAAAMGGFGWRHQRAILEPYVERFFASVAGIVASRDHGFGEAYFEQLFPAYRVEDDVLERAKGLLAGEAGRSPILARYLGEAIDELERALACRAYAAG